MTIRAKLFATTVMMAMSCGAAHADSTNDSTTSVTDFLSAPVITSTLTTADIQDVSGDKTFTGTSSDLSILTIGDYGKLVVDGSASADFDGAVTLDGDTEVTGSFTIPEDDAKTNIATRNDLNTAISGANSYADNQASSALSNAKTYADTKAESALSSAKKYADENDTDTLYTAGYGINLSSAKIFTVDTGEIATKEYVDSRKHPIEIGGEYSTRPTASGTNSIAGGDGAAATNVGASAYGLEAKAAGKSSVSVGHDATSSGAYSVAMGYRSKATGDYTTISGYDSSATSEQASAFGFGAKASGSFSTALGRGTTATGTSSVAVGDVATADYLDTAIGGVASAKGGQSTAVGFGASASGALATAVGRATVASAKSAAAFGEDTKATANMALALGGTATASSKNSVALGFSSLANQDDVVSVGRNIAGTNSSGETMAAFTRRVVNVSPGSGNNDAATYGQVISYSDRRLKQNIQEIDPEAGLDTVLSLNPVSFDWKENGNHSLGLIAQEVEPIVPSAIREETSGYKSLDYKQLIAPMVAAIQELSKENKELKADLKDLRDELAAVKGRAK